MFTALLLVASRAEEAGASEGYSDENLGDANSQFEGDDAPKKPTTHPDVKASFVFPDFAKPRFPMGEPVDMLVAFSNSGNKLFNVTELGGTLNSPYNFRFIVQNVRERRCRRAAPCATRHAPRAMHGSAASPVR